MGTGALKHLAGLQTFALSVLECGALLDLHPGMKSLDFFHDPFKGQQ